MKPWMLLVVWLAGSVNSYAQELQDPARTIDPRLDPDALRAMQEKQAANTLKFVKKVAACADRLEIKAVISYGDNSRRMGPIITTDQVLLNLINETLEKAKEAEKNPDRHTVSRKTGEYIEIDLVCTKGKAEERIRLSAREWIAMEKGEHYRVLCPCDEIWKRVKELADKEQTFEWRLFAD